MLQEFLSTSADTCFFVFVQRLAFEGVYTVGEASFYQRIVHSQAARSIKKTKGKLINKKTLINYNCIDFFGSVCFLWVKDVRNFFEDARYVSVTVVSLAMV